MIKRNKGSVLTYLIPHVYVKGNQSLVILGRQQIQLKWSVVFRNKNQRYGHITGSLITLFIIYDLKITFVNTVRASHVMVSST